MNERNNQNLKQIMLKTINSKQILVLVLTVLMCIFPANAQNTTHCVFLDLGKNPIYIDGILSGTTNKEIKVECGEHYIVIQRGKRFYGRKIKIDAYRREIDISAAPRVYGYEPPKTSNHESSVAAHRDIPSTSTANNEYTTYRSKISVSDTINAKHCGLTVFCENGKYGYKDKKGELVIPAKYSEANPFIDGLNCAIVKKKNKYGIINLANEFLVKPQYEEIEHVQSNHFIAKKKGLKGVITINNDVIIDFQYHNIEYTPYYYLCIRQNSNSNMHFIYKQNGKYLWYLNSNRAQIKYLGETFVLLYFGNNYCFRDLSMPIEQYIMEIPDLDERITQETHRDAINSYKQQTGNYDAKRAICAIEGEIDNLNIVDDIHILNNNIFIVSKYGRYGIVGADGKQIIAPTFVYIDIAKLEKGEWQYTTNNGDKKDIYFIRNNGDENGIEILTLDQYIYKYDNPWAKPFSINDKPIIDWTKTERPYRFESARWNDTISENIGNDTYIHDLYKYSEVGDLEFYVIKHCVDNQIYLYITRKNEICKKTPYQEFANFAELTELRDFSIIEVSTLSNGDIFLLAETSIVTGYDTYWRDPVYINVQGQLMVVDNGGTYNHYYREMVPCVYILDGETFNLKYSRIMPYEYDNIHISQYGGFYVTKNGEVTSENPLFKFSNNCEQEWSYVPNKGEGILCISEDKNHVYMGGYTMNQGYIGLYNPYICQLDKTLISTTKSKSYKIKGKAIYKFDGDKALLCGKATNQYGESVWSEAGECISLFDFDGNISLVGVIHNGLQFNGLVYNDTYWIIPPVLPGQEPETYCEWILQPSEVIYDKEKGIVRQILYWNKKNNEKVRVNYNYIID